VALLRTTSLLDNAIQSYTVSTATAKRLKGGDFGFDLTLGSRKQLLVRGTLVSRRAADPR
jgi:hypothetical protein